MEGIESQKPHVVLVPYPAQGHINPLMHLARLLYSRGFHITFVYTEYYKNRLVHTKGMESLRGLPSFRFEVIPDGLPPTDRPDAARRTADVCDSIRKYSPGPFKELLIRIGSSPSIPPVTCVISDAVMSFTQRVASELGILEIQFWTASACGLMGYCQFSELVRRGIVPLKDESYKSNESILETPLEWMEAMKGLKLKHLPLFCRTTNPEDVMLNFMIEQTENCKYSSGLIINTFDELEKDVLFDLSSIYPSIHTIGPLMLLNQKEPERRPIDSDIDSTLWKEDLECLQWLDKRGECSVVYVNFGSSAFLSDQKIEEFARGLVDCGFHFLWVLRPNLVMGGSAKLPERFLEDTRGQGLIVSWCPQEKVLSHGSVGLFVTHAGWNSLSESGALGVPVLCFPIIAEQPTNSWSVCSVWGNGMEIPEDVKHEELSKLVRDMMVGEVGKVKRHRALQWKRKAEEATGGGGSSSVNLDRLIIDVILRKKL